MTTNVSKCSGHRIGAVRNRSQTHNPRNKRWVKRNAATGRFIDQKSDYTPFKGVRKEIHALRNRNRWETSLA
jgi:hypothetical protein